MELLPGPCARVLKRFDQLGGPFVANPIQLVNILLRFGRGGDHEECRTFEQHNLSGTARLCQRREVFREDVRVGDQAVNYARPRLEQCINSVSDVMGDKIAHPVETLVVDTRPKHGDLQASALLFELRPLLG